MLRLLTDKIRPFASNFSEHERPALHTLCGRLYEAYYQLEADEDLTVAVLVIDTYDALIIYAHICEEDNDNAAAVLHQVRQALYELKNNRQAVQLASRASMEKLLGSAGIKDEG